jgi:ATP synthase subunit 6
VGGKLIIFMSTKIMFNLFSPLEQFEILPLIPLNNNFFYILNFSFFDLTITNESFIVFLVLAFFITFVKNIKKINSNSSYIIPENYQFMFEIIINLIVSLVKDNISGQKVQKFFSLIFVIFIFLALTNCIGMFPYSFTITSNLLATFYLGVSIFLGINIIAIRKHSLKIFSLFLPSGISIYLAFLLIPIEFISYIFKPISLSIRLFANMMAGHTLLKVIAGFIFTLAGSFDIFLLACYVPAFILLPLFVLEFAVALIQSFVFSVLICIYINDSLNLH